MDKQERLANEDVKTLLIKFSIPAIIAMLITALYNIVDRIFIGKIEGIGQYALTGIGLTLPITTVVLGFSMLVGIGAAATISIRLGQGRKKIAEKVLGNAFSLSIIFSIILTVIGLIFVDKLLYGFGASENTFVYAKEYIYVILLGTTFNMVGFSMNHTIRAEGNPNRSAATMLIGAVLNIILDPIFIFVFNMGVRGAAIATIISQLVSAIWVISYFYNKKSALRLRYKNMKIEWPIAKSIFAIGMSPFAIQIAASAVSIVANRSLKIYGGDLAIGAMTIINSVILIFLMPIFGINQGSQPIIGYNYGAKKYDRVLKTLKYAIFAATILVLIGFTIVEIFPETIIKIFNNDKELVKIGTRGLRIYLSMIPIIGFQIISTNYFQSIGKAKIAVFLSVLRQVILLIPLYIILPTYFGLTGVWLAGPISDLGASIITFIFLIREIKILKTEL
ncbi:MAG: MATE family efflux transporter [Clostridiaceae bacterium]